MKKKHIEYQSFYGAVTENEFFEHEEKSDSLAVIFPGRGYTCDKPLLYYAGMAALLKGCDVLNLEYGFYKAGKEFKSEDTARMVNELTAVIEKCNASSYLKIFFISKSLGTLFAGEATDLMKGFSIKNLFLTPVERTIPYMLKNKFIAVTGSADEFITQPNIDLVKNKPGSEIIIIDGADHSLETEISAVHNLEILRQIVILCEEFVS